MYFYSDSLRPTGGKWETGQIFSTRISPYFFLEPESSIDYRQGKATVAVPPYPSRGDGNNGMRLLGLGEP